MTPFEEHQDPTDAASKGEGEETIPSLDDTGEARGPGPEEAESPDIADQASGGTLEGGAGEAPGQEKQFGGESVEQPPGPEQTES